MDKLSSKVHKVHMELGGRLLNSLRIETQFLARLQSVRVVDGAIWWGLLHGPQQGPDRMKEKTYKTGKRKTPA